MLQVFYDAPLAIQIHMVSAVLAVVIGPFALWHRRRDGLHRALGYIWVTEMATVAGSSMFIRAELGIAGFGPIHLLSVWVLYVLWIGVKAARDRRVEAHQGAMRGLYVWGMGISALLTLLPGRRINAMLFGEDEMLGLVAIGLGLSLLALTQFLSQSRGRRPTSAA